MPLAQVFHAELWGDRKGKYEALWDGGLGSVKWVQLENRAPQYPFINRDFELEEKYLQGFGIHELMPENSVGIVTARDALTIDMDREALWKRVEDFTKLDSEILRTKYALGDDVQDWTVLDAKKDVTGNFSRERLVPISYRPFDMRWTYFTGNARGFQCRPREKVMRHYMAGENFGLLIPKAVRDREFAHLFMTSSVSEAIYLSGLTGSNAMNLPLYLYPDEQSLDQTRQVNMEPKIRAAIEKAATDKAHGAPDELAIFDYIYGVLHCPIYRQTYNEFLKIDFPRIPYPPSPEMFWDISAKGGQLRRLHLMEDAAIGETPYPFTGEGDAFVVTPHYEPVTETTGSVFINDKQQFENVPLISWEFWIGGYQPAQKWLKDRKTRPLSFEDVRHYQKIIKILPDYPGVSAIAPRLFVIFVEQGDKQWQEILFSFKKASA